MHVKGGTVGEHCKDPFKRNSTRWIPPASVAVAVIVSGPEGTACPLSGFVIVTVGGMRSLAGVGVGVGPGPGVFVGVRVGVAVGAPGVGVRVGVAVGAPSVGVRVGVAVGAAGVLVGPARGVFVGVRVAVGVGIALVAAIDTLSNVAVASSEWL